MGREVFLLLLLLFGVIKAQHDATSLCAALIAPNGYSCIEHQVVTDDGFILGLQNIPSPQGQTKPSGGPAVMLQHGGIAGGDNFVVNSPQESLGFVLADAGYDVWISNNRAVQWSHGHETYTPYEDAYWDWTYDELATYDLKAATEFVYNQRGGSKLTYIGHSQGTLMLMAGLTGGAFKTQILNCLNAAVFLAPVTSIAHVKALLMKVGIEIYGDVLLPAIGIREFDVNIFLNLTCTSPLTAPLTCDNIYTGILGTNNYVNISRLGFYTQYYPQPTSSFNANHFGQSYRTNLFQFYDKGLAGNLATYGQDQPPIYDLTTFPTSIPIQIWRGGADGLSTPIDQDQILAKLPSSNREVFEIADYGHIDFIVGIRAYLDVYPGLIEFLEKYS